MHYHQDVILSENLSALGAVGLDGYIAHAMCLEGECSFRFNGREFTLRQGDLMIVRKGAFVENLVSSPDFSVMTIYISDPFIAICTPQTNYGMKGTIELFMNPVLNLTPDMQELCVRDFRWIEERLRRTDHNFYRQALQNAVQNAILDFFDFHSKQFGKSRISNQNALVMSRFLEMLEQGEYRHSREVAHYADRLCVTPKYLSEISKRISGNPANHWITRYTTLDICRQLRNKSLTLSQIADAFHFSSAAYFCRYVQNHLGVAPSKLRE